MKGRITRYTTLVLLFMLLGGFMYYSKNKDTVNYISPYTYKEYDKSVYLMDRDKINIGIFDFNKVIQNDEKLKEYKEFGGDFILHGGKSKEFLELCAENDVGIFPAGLNCTTHNTQVHFVANAEPVETFNDLGSRYIDFGTVLGDDVFDEPSAVFFDNFQKIVDIYRTQVPNKIPYINLHPLNVLEQGSSNHFLFYGTDTYQQYIDAFCEKVDLDYICFDVYPFNNFSEGIYYGYLENLDIVVSACRESGRDFWIITQAGGNQSTDTLNKAQMEWQAYLSLAYGAVTIIHACYSPCWWAENTSLLNKAGEKNDLWYITKDLNTEIHALSDTFMKYKSTGVFTVGSSQILNEQMKNQNNRSMEKGITAKTTQDVKMISTDDAVLVGCFDKKDGDGSAMMFVNMLDPYDESANSKVTFMTRGLEKKKVTAYIDGVATVLEPLFGVYMLNLAGGEGIFVTVE